MIQNLRKPLALLAMLWVILVSCAPTQSILKAPEVAVQSLRLVSVSPPIIGSGTATFAVTMNVKNPNPLGIQVKLLSSDLRLDGTTVTTFEIPNLALSANGTSPVQTNIVVPISLALVQKFSDFTSGKNMNYQMVGNITVDAGVLGSPTFGPLTLAEGAVQR